MSFSRGRFPRSGLPPYVWVGLGGSAAAVLTTYYAFVDQVPLTNRRRWIATSVALEQRLGDQEYQRILSDLRRDRHSTILTNDHRASATVRRVGERIASAAKTFGQQHNLPSLLYTKPYTYTVVRSETANAFVLPGNHVVLMTGLFRYVKDEDDLAAVLGHEVSHNLARHAGEKISGNLLINLVARLSLLLDPSGTIFSLLLPAASLFRELPNSRQQEMEADQMGVHLAAEACFDPRAAPRVFRAMKDDKSGGRAPPEFLSTHPSHDRRIAKFDEYMPKAMEIYQGDFGDRCNNVRRAMQQARQVAAEQAKARENVTETGKPLVSRSMWHRAHAALTTPLQRPTQCEAATPATTSPPLSKFPGANLQKRMTTIGQFSMLSETPWNPSLVTLAMTLKGPPFTASDFIKAWQTQEMVDRHPRFHWTVSTQYPGHFDATRQSSFELPVSDSLKPLESKEREDLLARLTLAQLTPLELTKSLWKVQIVPNVTQGLVPSSKTAKGESRSIILWQSHHVLADGVSLGAALLDLADEAPAMRAQIRAAVQKRRSREKSWWQRLWKKFLLALWILLGSIPVFWNQFKLMVANWAPHPWRTLQKLVGGQEPSRTLACTSAGTVAQAKWVAQTLSRGQKKKLKITINDVFVSVITSALIRQLKEHRERLHARLPVEEEAAPSPLVAQHYMTVVIPVHLRGGVLLPEDSVGNKIGAFGVRVPAENELLTPVERLHQVHRALQAVKQSPAPFWSFGIATAVTKLLPSSWASYIFKHSSAGATVVVTNVKGPDKALHYQGREVEAVHGFIPIPPGIPVGVTINSYNGKINLGLTAESWAVPDGDRFLSFVLEEYLKLVRAAKDVSKGQTGSE